MKWSILVRFKDFFRKSYHRKERSATYRPKPKDRKRFLSPKGGKRKHLSDASGLIYRGPERPRRRAGVRTGNYGRYDRYPIRAGTDDITGIGVIYAAYPDQGNANGLADSSQNTEPRGWQRIGLGRRGKQGPYPQVVRPIGFGLKGFIGSTDGNPDDHIFAGNPARKGAMHIILSQMNSIGPAGQRDVHPVVDYERDGKVRSCFPERKGLLDKLPCPGILFTKLDHGDTARCALAIDLLKRAAAGQDPVGDQVQSKINSGFAGFHEKATRARALMM